MDERRFGGNARVLWPMLSAARRAWESHVNESRVGIGHSQGEGWGAVELAGDYTRYGRGIGWGVDSSGFRVCSFERERDGMWWGGLVGAGGRSPGVGARL